MKSIVTAQPQGLSILNKVLYFFFGKNFFHVLL
jgi:hypothetical protein